MSAKVIPTFTVDGIPAELRELNQWVIWHREERDDKTTKVPYQVGGDPSQRASSTDPRTWSSLDAALSAWLAGEGDGIGFVFASDDPFTGVDLDDCFDGDGELHPAANAIVTALDSYTERSPSGWGLHIIVRAEMNGTRNRTGKTPWGGGFEAYSTARFFCMTADRLLDTPVTIERRQAELNDVLAEAFPAASSGPGDGPPPTAALELDDQELLRRAFAAKNGSKTEALYRGDASIYSSPSEADLALCSAFAFWTGPDPARLERLVRGSALRREKWDEARSESTYIAQTIARALEGQTEFYSPRGRNSRDQAESESGAPTGEPSHPFALRMDEFIAATSDAPPALIGSDEDNLLPTHGLMLLVARGGKGKTTLTIDQAFHLASGVEWLGFEVPRPLRVLFIENEGPREPFRRKLELKREHWEHPITGGIYVYDQDWGRAKLDQAAFVERLNAFAAEHEVDLIIGDPLDTFGMEGVGSPEDTRNMVERLQRAGLFSTVAWEMLHHSRKESVADAVDEASGAWAGKPDSLLVLEKQRGNRARLSFPKVRWSRRGERGAYVLSFEPETEAFEIVHQESTEERDLAAEIEELLAERPHLTAKEIAAKDDGIGANVDRIKEELKGNPERFTARTGDEAKELDRHPSATLWELTRPQKSAESPDLSGVDRRTGDSVTPPLRESPVSSRVTPSERVADSELKSAESPAGSQGCG